MKFKLTVHKDGKKLKYSIRTKSAFELEQLVEILLESKYEASISNILPDKK